MKMKTTEIMKIPNRYGKSLDSCYKAVYSGQEVLDNFYSVGIWRDNYIPKELKDSNWIPDVNKKYVCWWYNTNPADPADSGENILFYIEEYKNHEAFKSSGCVAIFKERQRQVEVEHCDVEYDTNELIENLIWASAAYATGCRRFWPWDLRYYKPGDLSVSGIRKDLVKAGALIAAAIDKIDRGETIELE